MFIADDLYGNEEEWLSVCVEASNVMTPRLLTSTRRRKNILKKGTNSYPRVESRTSQNLRQSGYRTGRLDVDNLLCCGARVREKSDDASRTRDEYRQREFLKSACEMREVVDQNENRTRAREETERQRDREIDTPGNETEETRSNRRVPHGVGCCCCVCVCVCA